jgi:hypothetical protein
MLRSSQASVEELLRMVESVKNMMVARATGETTEYSEYQDFRLKLLSDSRTKDLLPRFVHTCRSMGEFWNYIKPKIDGYAPRREYLRQEFDPLLAQLENWNATPSDDSTTAALQKFDSEHVTEAWRKAQDRKTTDPEGAITAAKTLLESVCKHILDELAEPYSDKSDLRTLYNQAAKLLNLSPSQHTEQVFKQILSGCHSVVEGLGALRNSLSDAHGKGKAGVKPLPRHAELAVNLAGTMATFLITTYEAKVSS